MSDKGTFGHIRPVRDYCLVQQDRADAMTKGGIIIPDNAKERPVIGTVLAVGPGRVLETGVFVETEVKVGDRVLYGKYAAIEVSATEKDVFLVKATDIHAVLEEG